MKQKFQISMAGPKKRLIIREFAELDKEIMSMTCEETYDIEKIKKAIKTSREALVKELRSLNVYPPREYAIKIAESVSAMFESETDQTVDLLFDDVDLIKKEQKIVEEIEKIKETAADIDELLEDDIDDKIDEKNPIEKIKSSIKVAGDESINIEDQE